MTAKRNTIFFAVVLLAGLFTCSDDPYPVYNEGEVLWQGTELPVWFTYSEMEPAITPDGKYLIFRSVYSDFPNHTRLMKKDLTTEEETMITAFGYGIDLSPDGRWVAFNSSYGVISKIKLNGDSLLRLSVLPTGSDFSPTWSPDGKSIVYVHHGGGASDPSGLWHILTNRTSNEYLFQSGGTPDFFPDGNRIISGKSIDNMSIWRKFLIHDIETKMEIARLNATKDEDNRYPKVSPDGNHIVYWNTKGVYVMDADGSDVFKVVPHKHFYEQKQGDYLGFMSMSPSWHPDGKHIVYQHFAITEHIICPDNMYCTYSEAFKGIASIRLLRIK